MANRRDPEVLETFIDEVDERLTLIEAELGSFDLAPGADNTELVNDIFRAAHSLKSTANLLDFRNVERLAHAMENILDDIRAGSLAPTQPIVDQLMDGAWAIRDLADDLDASDEVDISGPLANLDKPAV